MDPASHGNPATRPGNVPYVDELADILLDHHEVGLQPCPENGGRASSWLE
jgi:hypothetical protein